MALHPLDLATALDGAPDAPERTARTSDGYWTFISPFGGVSAATALRAVLEHPGREGDPLAMTVNFCAPIERGAYTVRVKRNRANRSSQHWSIEFTQGASEEAVLTASVVTAIRRETWSHRPASAPVLPAWESLPPYDSRKSLPWVAQYDIRFVSGEITASEATPEPPNDARSVLWIRDAEPRTLDFLSLVALSDAFFGRIFQVIGRVPPFGTVSLATYFHADAAELAAQGTAPLAGTADARVFHRSFSDQTVELWGTDGHLLATSVQAAYYRV